WPFRSGVLLVNTRKRPSALRSPAGPFRRRAPRAAGRPERRASPATVCPLFRSRMKGSVRAPLSSPAIRFDASEENATFEPSPLMDGAVEPPSAEVGENCAGVPPRAFGDGAALAAAAGMKFSTPGGHTSDDGRKKCPKSAWW